jgi:hypothetical protein
MAEKTPGQVAFEAFHGEGRPYLWDLSRPDNRDAWEHAAKAVLALSPTGDLLESTGIATALVEQLEGDTDLAARLRQALGLDTVAQALPPRSS